MRAAAALLLALGLAGCGSSTNGHDGGGGSGGAGGASDLATASGDLSLACTMPGPCDNGAGVCCVRAIGPRELLFCDTTTRCPLQHGLDTYQSPLCNTDSDCYAAQHRDLGTLYCCPDPNFGVKVCRIGACP